LPPFYSLQPYAVKRGRSCLNGAKVARTRWIEAARAQNSAKSSWKKKCIQNAMKFKQRKLQIAHKEPGTPRVDDAKTLSNMIHAPSACIIDFFEARDRLSGGFEGGDKEFTKSRKVRALRLRSIERLEESVYWLLTAATFVYLLIEILGR
jgi:hypothetical protein